MVISKRDYQKWELPIGEVKIKLAQKVNYMGNVANEIDILLKYYIILRMAVNIYCFFTDEY